MATYFRTHSTNLAKRILVHRNRDLVFKEVSEIRLLVAIDLQTVFVCNSVLFNLIIVPMFSVKSYTQMIIVNKTHSFEKIQSVPVSLFS